MKLLNSLTSGGHWRPFPNGACSFQSFTSWNVKTQIKLECIIFLFLFPPFLRFYFQVYLPAGVCVWVCVHVTKTHSIWKLLGVSNTRVSVQWQTMDQLINVAKWHFWQSIIVLLKKAPTDLLNQRSKGDDKVARIPDFSLAYQCRDSTVLYCGWVKIWTDLKWKYLIMYIYRGECQYKAMKTYHTKKAQFIFILICYAILCLPYFCKVVFILLQTHNISLFLLLEKVYFSHVNIQEDILCQNAKIKTASYFLRN